MKFHKKIALTATLTSLALIPLKAKAADGCWVLSYAYNMPGSQADEKKQQTQPYSGIASMSVRRSNNKNPPTWTEMIQISRINALQSKIIDQRGTVTPIALSTLSCEPNPIEKEH